MVACDYKVVHQNFKFFGKESNRYLLNLIEILSIKRGNPHFIRAYTARVFTVLSIPYRIISFYVTLLQILF